MKETKEIKKDNYVKTGKVIVTIFDVEDGNPGGDPKMNNMPRPRVDGKIWVSGESKKYKIRRRLESFGKDMFISKGISLNNRISALKGENGSTEKNNSLLDTYLDARIFGAVANTGENSGSKKDSTDEVVEKDTTPKDKKKKSKGNGMKGAGTVHGPVQIHDAVSINIPIVELAGLIRCVQTKEDDNHTMGSRYKVQYAAFKGTCQISGERAKKAKMTEEDEKLFIEAYKTMFVGHASNSSGIQRMRKMFIFEGEDPNLDIGVIDAVKTRVKEGVEIATSFDDIEVVLDKSFIPVGVKVTEIL